MWVLCYLFHRHIPSNLMSFLQPSRCAFTPLIGCLVAVCSLLATVSVVHAATEPTNGAVGCVPPVGKTVDGRVPPPIYFNRFTREGPLMRLEGRTDKDNKLISVERIAVSDDEVKQLCDAGFPIAVVDASQAPKSTNTGSRQGLPVKGGDTRASQPAPQDG